MRRLLSGLAAFSLLTVQQAQAQLQCLPPQERAAVEVAALRSELMVLATGCHDDDGYNAFIHKFQPELMGNEQAISEIFKKKYGRRGQQEHDQFVTDLANAESSAGMRLGTDFCERFPRINSGRNPRNQAHDQANEDYSFRRHFSSSSNSVARRRHR